MNLKESLWPITQSLDLFKDNFKNISECIYSEISKYTNTESGIIQHNIIINNMKDLIQVFDEYTNIPTQYLIFQVNTDWTCLLTNCFLCDGYDSLAYNITRIYHYDTFHLSSHDETTTFLPGSYFTYRKYENNDIIERRVQASIDDFDKWKFFESGESLNWEVVENYKKKKIKDRLNESIISDYLFKLDININKDETIFDGINAIKIKRTKFPETITKMKYNFKEKKFT